MLMAVGIGRESPLSYRLSYNSRRLSPSRDLPYRHRPWSCRVPPFIVFPSGISKRIHTAEFTIATRAAATTTAGAIGQVEAILTIEPSDALGSYLAVGTPRQPASDRETGLFWDRFVSGDVLRRGHQVISTLRLNEGRLVVPGWTDERQGIANPRRPTMAIKCVCSADSWSSL